MEIKNQPVIGSEFQTFSTSEPRKIAKGSAKPEREDHVNGLLSDAEIATKHLDKEQKSLKIKEEKPENQVAVSKDGDTLQISEEASLKFQKTREPGEREKASLKKDAEASKVQREELQEKERKLERIKEEMKEAERKRELQEEENKVKMAEAEKREVLFEEVGKKREPIQEEKISFSGKSDSDLAKMYLRGDITKAEYDSVIEQRESEREAMQTKEREFQEETMEGVAKTEEMERFALELERAFSENSSAILKPTERLETIEAAEGKIEKKEQKEVKFSVK